MEEKIANDFEVHPMPSTLNLGVEGGRRGVATELVTIHSYKRAVELLRTFFRQPLAWTVCFGFSVCRALTHARLESTDGS